MRKMIVAAVAALALVSGAAVAQSGFVGEEVTDRDGMWVGTVTDVTMDDSSAMTLTGVVIKTNTGSFLAPPSRLMFNAEGKLILDASSAQIAAMPQFGGDSAESAKGEGGGSN